MDAPLTALRHPPTDGFLPAVERLWDAGSAVLPLPWHALDSAVVALLDEIRPTAVLDLSDGSDRPVPWTRGRPVAAGTALVVATSGTSGRPKGVELSHDALAWSLDAGLDRLGARSGERWLGCLPLHHVAGLATLLRSRRLGTAAAVHDGFDVAAVAAARAQWVSLVPTQLHRLLEADADLAHFRGVLLGGGAVEASLLSRARARDVRVVTSYGMTETCGGCVYDGVALDGAAFRLETADDGPGRVLLRGPMLMSGYRGRPELTAAALDGGWLRTPDLGRRTEDGRLEVLGRSDDVIVSGGENVAAATVATALRSLPAVADAAVTARPDEVWGEVVVAVIVAAGAPPSLAQLRTGLRAKLPAAALPRALAIVDHVPRTELGKVSRTWLAEMASTAAS